MDRPTYTFKVGQHVFYHRNGQPRGTRTGPYVIVGLVRQPDGAILNRTHDRLAHKDELKLALAQPL
jgi:hypothetical protein